MNELKASMVDIISPFEYDSLYDDRMLEDCDILLMDYVDEWCHQTKQTIVPEPDISVEEMIATSKTSERKNLRNELLYNRKTGIDEASQNMRAELTSNALEKVIDEHRTISVPWKPQSFERAFEGYCRRYEERGELPFYIYADAAMGRWQRQFRLNDRYELAIFFGFKDQLEQERSITVDESAANLEFKGVPSAFLPRIKARRDQAVAKAATVGRQGAVAHDAARQRERQRKKDERLEAAYQEAKRQEAERQRSERLEAERRRAKTCAETGLAGRFTKFVNQLVSSINSFFEW